MNERDLIQRARTGDPLAERKLYDAHVDRVYRLAWRYAGDEDLAREITQETFIRVFDKLGSFRGEAALSTWIHSIASTVALNVLRKVKRFRQRETDLSRAAQHGRGTDRIEPDLKDRLKTAIDELGEKYRMVLILHDIEGFKHEEIAGILGIRVGTSKAQLSRARAKLREALAPFEEEWAS